MSTDPESSGSPLPHFSPGRGKKLRDAVHRDIHLSEPELRVLDTPQMQRLRYIRQLGAACYVYPAAQHTRFEHCLGTCWMAKRIAARIESEGAFHFPQVHKQAVFLAALAHDVTHIPFGHTFEDERKLLPRHDESDLRYRHFLEQGELGRVLGESEAGLLARDILRPGHALPPQQRCLRQIVSGTICADLLDYLRRDNYFCGLARQYDPRVFDYFTVRDGQLVLDLQRRGLLRPDALSEITNLLRIRYVLSERIYYHHAKIACGVMISKAVERAIAGGLTETELYGLGDDSLLYHLRQRYGDDPALAELLDAFRSRRLFKRGYMLSRRIGEDAVRELVGRYHFNRDGARVAAEEQIAGALGAPAHEVAIYCAPEHMALKEADMPVILGGGRTGGLAELGSAEIGVLKDQHRQLWRLYVFVAPPLAARREAVSRACEEVIGPPDELPRDVPAP